MEPVFMVLGQSVATAAAQAIDYATLRERLVSDKQILTWPKPPPK